MERGRRMGWGVAALAGFAALLVAISWQRWGNPVSDPGLDLTVSANWLHGVVPYRDVRYWYGPLGIAGLSASFAVLGTSMTAAYAYGLVQTVAIAELWRRLARRWLPPGETLAGVAVVLAIGFSGSLFNYQLPHTEAATAGLIALLALLLALAAERRWLPGVALGALALTRPEFFAFGIAAIGGAALGAARVEGWGTAVRLVARTIPGTLIVGGVVLGWFAAQAGAHELFTENLFPVEFVRTVGGRFEHGWHPYDLPSAGTLLLRGAVAVAGVAAVAAVLLRGEALGSRLIRIAGWLVAAAFVATVLAAIGGDAAEPARLVAQDAGRLLLPMTVLPAIALGTLAVAARAWWRGAPSPLGGSWVADGALIAAAAACTLRSYHQFSTDVYATYYAPPAVLVAAILLSRALRDSRVPAAATAVLAASAGMLAAHAWLGRYRDFGVPVHTPRGTFMALSDGGPNVQKVVDLLRTRVRENEPMLVLPQEAGFHFLLHTTPALYDATFLPGTLATDAEDRRAAEQIAHGSRPRFAIVAARRFEAWGFHQSGEDFNRALMAVVRRDYRPIGTFGDTAHPPASDEPPTAYTVYERVAP